ncbi:MAG: hypothetical protein GY774_24470 [Planctomycetes bacterium]|nr:hypothetical protein [Planctomycetota bacterium]
MAQRVIAQTHTPVHLGAGVWSGGPSVDTVTWQLPAANYVSTAVTGMLPVITYPEVDTETNSDAYCRNAYTGMHWEIPIVVNHGSWPFKYEIVSGPAGMVIGETLTVVGDKQIVGDDYAVLSWPSPTGTSESITIRVTDQDANTTTVTFTLTIGTTGFVFIDAAATDDTGAGTLADPLKTFQGADASTGLWRNSNTNDDFTGKIAVFKTGTYVIDTNDGGDYVEIDSTYKPRTYVAYHNGTSYEAAEFDTTNNHIESRGVGDFTLHSIRINGCMGETNNKVVRQLMETDDRHLFYKLKFANVDQGTAGSDNPSCISGIGQVLGEYRSKTSVIRCEAESTVSVTLYKSYNSFQTVLEHNFTDGLTLIDSNSDYFFQLKADCYDSTVRRNMLKNIISDGASSGLEISRLTFWDGSCDDTEVCWNLVMISDKHAAVWNRAGYGAFDPPENGYDYRNTYISTAHTGVLYADNGYDAGMGAEQPVISIGNALHGGIAAIEGTAVYDYTDIGNQQLAADDFDANGNLVDGGTHGTARTTFLGTVGYEVSQ